MSQEIRPMTKADYPAVAEMLGRAFHDDPVWLHMLRDPKGREARIGAAMATLIRGHIGHDHTWVTSDCSAIGAWGPPGHWKTPPWLYVTHGIPLLRAIGVRNLRHVATLAHVEKFHPREPHYYLALLGTDPPSQGKGLGSRLVRMGTDLADSAGLGSYLESSKKSNVPYYERHGFRVTEEIQIPGDGPIIYGMWRDPQPPE